MERPDIIDFFRETGPIELTGIRAGTIDDLRRELGKLGLAGAWTVSDLTLGAWRGQQVATELMGQLGIEMPPLDTAAPMRAADGSAPQLSYADVVGRFIDAEARGDRATRDGLLLAGLVREQLREEPPRLLLILAPRADAPWERENLLFIRSLAQAVRSTQSTLLLVATGGADPAQPEGWRVSWHGRHAEAAPATTNDDPLVLIPGVLQAEVAGAIAGADRSSIEHLIRLDGGYLMVPPELRPDPTAASPLLFDRLSAGARSIGWLDAFAQCHGSRIHVEPWLLYLEALKRFAEGGSGITLRLAERAIACAPSPAERGIFESHAQGMRIALGRFREAASVADPPESVPPEIRGFLLQSKGWGLVMTNDAAGAERCFAQARELLSPLGRDRREFLYLLNISALCRLKSGDLDGAMSMEREIEERSAALVRPDRRLDYVNSINIARLHRRRNDLEESERYFRRAFDTTLGARSQSDAIYTNVIMARLHADRGRPAESLRCWIRAALHWLAGDAPEAIGPRCTAGILGRKPAGSANVPEEVSAALRAAVATAAARGGMEGIAERARARKLDLFDPPSFCTSARFLQSWPVGEIDEAILAGGIGVYLSGEHATPQIIGPETARLRTLMLLLLEELTRSPLPAGAGTVIVDDAFGREIPSNVAELLAGALRLGAGAVAIDGALLPLDPELRDRMLESTRLRIGPAVDRLGFHEGRGVILFKRYLSPTMLSPEESALLRLLGGEPTIAEIAARLPELDREEIVALARGLEEKRVVELYLAGEDAGAFPVARSMRPEGRTRPEPARAS